MNALNWSGFFLVALGGALGSAARWVVNAAVAQRYGTDLPWPWPTFAVNVAGSLLIGLVAGLASNGTLTPVTRLFLAVGVLGGFTTFSSFSFELLSAVESGRTLVAAAYALASVTLGLAAAAAGIGLARMVR